MRQIMRLHPWLMIPYATWHEYNDIYPYVTCTLNYVSLTYLSCHTAWISGSGLPLCLMNTDLHHCWGNSSWMHKLKTKGQPLDDMSHNLGVLFWPCACWLCPLLCPVCSVRLPGHWAWHIRTVALLVPSFIPTITESKPAETELSRDWALLGLTGPRSHQAWRRGSSSSPTSTCYDLWTDSKKAPDLIRADSPFWKLPLVLLL